MQLWIIKRNSDDNKSRGFGGWKVFGVPGSALNLVSRGDANIIINGGPERWAQDNNAGQQRWKEDGGKRNVNKN